MNLYNETGLVDVAISIFLFEEIIKIGLVISTQSGYNYFSI